MKHKFNHHKPKHPHRRPHHHSGGGPRPPLTPATPGKGLSSELNYRYTLEILKHSDRSEIARVLTAAGYGGTINTAKLDAAVDGDVQRYLQTEDGKRRRQATLERSLRRLAEEELASEAGRRRLEQVKADEAADRLAQDADLFARLCHGQLRRLVAEWLATPAGVEAVEQARLRAAAREVRPPKWTQKPLREGTEG